MAVRVNTANDWQLAEDPETILYGSKAAEKPPDESLWVSVTYAEVFPIKKDRLTTDSLLANMDLTVRLYKAKLGVIVPKIDDIWKRSRDNTYWVVKIVDVLSFGNEYRLHCVKSTKR